MEYMKNPLGLDQPWYHAMAYGLYQYEKDESQ